jgi:hypothetical protein
MPEPRRPGRRSSSGRPNNPASAPRLDESPNLPESTSRRHCPGLVRASGSLWEPMDLRHPRAFGEVVGDSGNRRQERPGDPHDPLPSRMGVPREVSKPPSGPTLVRSLAAAPTAMKSPPPHRPGDLGLIRSETRFHLIFASTRFPARSEVSTRGETNPRRTDRCIKSRGDESIIIWGHPPPGGQRWPLGPSSRSPREDLRYRRRHHGPTIHQEHRP